MEYRHVDVFTKKPFSGNGLTVFFANENTESDHMQKITAEMRQFESLFLIPTDKANTFKAKIFTVQEELDFAGHPILGAASVLHEKFAPTKSKMEWTLLLNRKSVSLSSTKHDTYYHVTMEQGEPIFHEPLLKTQSNLFLTAHNLSPEDADEHLPMQVVSTGLPFLIMPIKSGIEKARVIKPDFDKLLQTVHAKFAYVFDTKTLEARSWDNDGAVEDIATGSAAGPLGAYLVKHQFAPAEKPIIIHQGKFTGRPSEIAVSIIGSAKKITSVNVSGDVCMVARGMLD